MRTIFEKVVDFWINEADLRSLQMFLIKSPFPIIFILLIYFIVIKFIIPSITKNQKHPHLRHLLSFYYVIHSSLSIVIILIWIFVAFKMNFNLRCEPISHGNGFYSRLIILMSEIFLWFKFSEMVETFLLAIVNGRAPIFNILHHTLYPCMLAIGIRFYPGKFIAKDFFPTVNEALKKKSKCYIMKIIIYCSVLNILFLKLSFSLNIISEQPIKIQFIIFFHFRRKSSIFCINKLY
ncbi:hypothetical protein ACKWTF_016779 [Chironomus riparius]